ncbi:hypothetical protein HBI23_157270 [Parastagonospora nodorum]|nr:hypothetical protein HBI10_065810 [Parastagonospora nodorum]KAH4028218.1 hypothetical protein HBI13_052250 [Parastagonospora nodorum]KAH4227267.1 hypothetical protein HBI06_104610 [Parastagonospora nodorum]KAH4233979.1 hypothetical protein HBI05_159080 [Parastagonospora nodorum]KAH4605931.1 hypothetical protein HBH82_115360 [Parastagonospora nodorum]
MSHHILSDDMQPSPGQHGHQTEFISDTTRTSHTVSPQSMCTFAVLDQRPGGMLPVPMHRFSRQLDENEYPRNNDRPHHPNSFYMRNGLLNLAADEHQYPCWGVYALTPGNVKYMRCPHIQDPSKCRNNHNLQQAVVDFVVGKRGVTHRVIRNLMASIELTGVNNIPEIRMPSFPSSIGPTPAQLRGAQASHPPGPTPREASNMPLPGPPPVTVAPLAQGPESNTAEASAGTKTWKNFWEVIGNDDKAKSDHAQKNPPTRTPHMSEKRKYNGITTEQVHESVPLRHQPSVYSETSSAPPAATAAPSDNATQQSGGIPETSSPSPAATATSDDDTQQSGGIPVPTPAPPATVAPSESVIETPDEAFFA